jgi:ribose transport system permease protein
MDADASVLPWRTRTAIAGLRRAAVRYAGVLVALALLVGWQVSTEPQFATWGNLVNILETNAALLVVSVGLTFVMLVGGFDLSLGGALALSGVLFAKLIFGGVPTELAAVLVVGCAVAIGLVLNGVPIAVGGLSFFVVTIGTASAFRSTALVVTGGSTQGLYDEPFLRSLGSGRIVGVPWLVVVAATVLAVGGGVSRYTGYGRMLYAVGGNPEAARLAGINVRAIKLSAYALSGGFAGLAGVMTTARLASASPDVGLGIELTASAAVLIGGTSFLGGSGSMTGTLLGVLFLGVLSNSLTLAGISAFWQGLVSGSVLVLAVGIDRLRSLGLDSVRVRRWRKGGSA